MSKISKFVAVVVAIAAIAVGSAQAAYMHSVTLKMGMTNANVMELQKTLNANGFLVSSVGAGSPGMESMYFGAKTKAAVMAFQTAKGLGADGVVGMNTGAALAALTGVSTGGNLPAGCASTAGYSTVTGQPCSGGSMVPGCTSTVGYSPTTGQPCNGSNGGSTSGPLSGTAGDITVSSYTSGLETQVGEGSSNTKVLGFEVKADAGSDVSLSSVKVTFANSNTSSSRRLTRYVNSVSIWDQSGNKVGSSSASDFSEDSNVYSRSISLSNVVVRADQKARFYVSVDAVSNIDSNDYNNDAWYVGLDSIRFSDASGAILTDSQGTTNSISNVSTFSSFNRAFNFTSLAGANDLELKVNLSSSNMKAQTVKVSTTSQTNNVELLKFTLKAQGGKMMIDQIPVLLATSGTNLSQVTGNVTLSIDGSEFSESVTATGTSTTVIFNDLNLNLAKDETITGTVTADINSLGVTTPNYGQGATLTASIGSLTSFDVEDENGDPVTSGNGDITGSAVGEAMTFRSTGVNVVKGTPSISKTTDQNGNITQVQYTIPVTVTSFGNTLYVGQSAQVAGSVLGTNAFNVVYENSTTPSTETTSGTSTVTVSSSARTSGSAYTLSDGQSETFTITVNLIDPAAAGSYRVRLDQIKTFTDAGLSAGAAASDLLPVESYRTDFQLINS